MNKLSGRFGYLSLLLAILILAGGLVYGIVRLYDAREDLDRGFSESLSWTVFQAEAELLRLHALFEHAVQYPDESERQKLLLRTEIFWSRINLLKEGEVGARIAEAAGGLSFLESLIADLERATALLETHPELDAETLESIEGLTDAWEGPLNNLALTVFKWEQARDEELRQQVDTAHQQIIWSGSLVAAGVVILVLMLVGSLRRSSELIREVTRTKDRVDAARAQMRLAIESINHGFAYYDADDRLIICNQMYREIYRESAAVIRPGVTFEEILRYGLEEGQYEEAIGREEEWLAERLERHRNPGEAVEQKLKDGRWILIEERRTPEGGNVGIRVDITELKAAREKAEQLTELKSQFLAVMSHEIRTPLGGIIGMLDLLREEALPPAARDQLETAITSAEHLNIIVNDILDLSKLEAEKVSFEAEVFELNDLVETSLKLVEPKASRKGLTIRADVDEAVPPFLIGDVSRLRQVLINLLDNAVKFTDGGMVRATLSLAEERDDRIMLRCEVRDRGIGIAKDQQERLFGDFSQLDHGFARRFGGSGLGLAICRRIIEALGGRIGVESTPLQGSTFWFIVPLKVANPPVFEPSRASFSSEVALPRSRSGSGRSKLLLAEDNLVNQKLILTYLQRAGYDVALARNGREAIEMVAKQPFDLILMDVSMPELDGLEAARTIRALAGPNRATPIVAVTANALHDDADNCLAAGMNDYLSKPIDRTELERIVAHWLNRSPAPSEEVQSPQETSSRIGDACPPLLDLATISDLLDNLEVAIVDELVESFLSDSDKRLRLVEEALDPLDRTLLKHEAHSMKGAAATFGAARFGQHCGALESAAEVGAPEELSRLVLEMRKALDQTGPLIVSHLGKHSPA